MCYIIKTMYYAYVTKRLEYPLCYIIETVPF
jgi:hypothetical protein